MRLQGQCNYNIYTGQLHRVILALLSGPLQSPRQSKSLSPKMLCFHQWDIYRERERKKSQGAATFRRRCNYNISIGWSLDYNTMQPRVRAMQRRRRNFADMIYSSTRKRELKVFWGNVKKGWKGQFRFFKCMPGSLPTKTYHTIARLALLISYLIPFTLLKLVDAE